MSVEFVSTYGNADIDPSHLNQVHLFATPSGKHFFVILANNQSKLCKDGEQEQGAKSGLHQEDLEIGFDKSDTRTPVEGLPSITHANNTTASNDLRDDLAAKAAVERNDRLHLIREERSLNTGQDNIGGDNDQECKNNAKHENTQALEK